jgi:hypothetical protein
MTYAILPWSVKYVMSLCHIWFGVDRSNRRGGGFGFLRGGTLPATRSAAFRCWRTVSGLACRQNSRRRSCEIRFTPRCGSSRFKAEILSFTGPGNFAGPSARTAVWRPASPNCR